MSEMLESLLRSDYMPHGHCYWWKPEILWLNVVSDVFIAVAYFSIPFALYYFVKRRTDIEFRGIFILFSAFIFMCGITHLISIVVIWHGWYGIHGMAKFLTAIVSCLTAYKVYQSMPLALQIPTKEQIKEANEQANKEKLERIALENKRAQDAILRHSTDNAHIGIMVIDSEGKIRLANQAVCKIFEYESDELEGQHVNILVNASFANEHSKLVQHFIEAETIDKEMAADRIVHGVSKSGKLIPIEVKLNHQTYQQQPVVFVSLQDISQRLQNERARQRSEMATRNILQSLPLGMHIFQQRNDTLFFTEHNPYAMQLLKNRDLPQGTIREVFPCVTNDADIERYMNVALNSLQGFSEVVYHEVNNERRCFLLHVFQSNPGQVIVVFDDVTLQREAETALREKEHFIGRIVDSSIAGIYIYDIQSQRISYNNERCTAITGYTNEDFKRLNANELIARIHPDDRRRYLAHIAEVTKCGDSDHIFSIEYRVKHECGEWIWLLEQDVVFESGPRGPTAILGSYLDISPIKEMQSDLMILKEKAEAASQAKTEFLANMSHEIRTPMNAIIGLTQLTLDGALNNTQRKHLSQVYEASRSLLQILNDILDYSKLEAGQLKVSANRFDLSQLLAISFRLFTISAQRHQLKLTIQIDPNVPHWLLGDGLRLGQVVNNLLGNAVKFTSQGEICIKVSQMNALASKPGDKVMLKIEIIDTGIGISEEQASQLFSSFTQGSSEITRRYGGTGLGLAICKRLCNLLGGNISFSSKLNQGSTFVVELPFTVAEAPNERIAPELENVNVALVTDDVRLVTIVTNYASPKGANLSHANDIEAWIATAQRCDVLMLDVGYLSTEQLLVVARKLAAVQRDTVTQGIIFLSSENTLINHLHNPLNQIRTAWLVRPFIDDEIEQLLQVMLANQDLRSGLQASKQLYLAPKFEDCRILLVEDNPTNQYVAQLMLNQMEIEVITADDGQQALDILAQEPVDAVIMDIHMPVMDGLTAARAIRKNPKWQNIPILAMSAAVLDEDIQQVRDSGMNTHIPKPVDRKQLGDTLKEFLPNKIAAVQPSQAPLTGIDMLIDGLAEFDVKTAIARLGSNVDTYLNLLKNYYDNYKDKDPQQMLRQLQGDERRRYLHTLKGLSQTIGADGLYRIVLKLEKDPAPTNADQEEFVNQYLSVIDAIHAILLKTQQNETTPTAVSGVSGGIDKFKDKLTRASYISDAEFRALEEELSAQFSSDQINEMRKAIARLDYAYVLNVLKAV